MKFCVFSSDPLYKYYEKGEIKERYWNPEGLFEEVCVFSFCDRDIKADKVQALVGSAKLEIIPIGYPVPHRLWGQYRQAARQMQAIGPAIVRVHNPWHAGLVGIAAARKYGIPTVLSLHTHYDARRRWEKRLLLQALRLFELYSVSRADVVLCVSHYLEGYARKMGARSIEVIYNRVYADQFHHNQQAAERRPIILSVGRLDPPKDQACLIRALAGLDAELLLVGDGENRAYLEGIVEELALVDRVHFVGSVAHAKIQDYYADADIFALATHYEGFGMPVLEAMAASLPVVVCTTEPLPEILGGQGLVVEHDPDAFHHAFAELLADRARARALGRGARGRAEALDGRLMEAREAELYLSLIKK